MSDEFEILPFSSELAPWFERLNVEWLEKYFYVEDIDRKILGNPEREIIASGGLVLFGRYRGEIELPCG